MFPDVDWKLSLSEIHNPFDTIDVKEHPSLVGFNTDIPYSIHETGVHLNPLEFHKKAKDSDSLIIDVRNSYEYDIGHFQNAINPNTRNFTQFSSWIDSNELQGIITDKRQILMYCTGGVRCEKASIELKKRVGSKIPIYQLKGGIHRYLEHFESDMENSLFEGNNFVFDKRCFQEGKGKVGVCSVCSSSFDKIHQDRRCKKCRMLILVCDDCNNSLQGDFWCINHEIYDVRKYQDKPETISKLSTHINSLKDSLKSEDIRGRRKRNKRLAIKKEIAALEEVLFKIEK